MSRRGVGLSVLAGVITLIALGHFTLSRMDFGESKASDETDDPRLDFPDFRASDPTLTTKGPHEVRVTIIGAEDKAVVPGVQYFIVIADGRWACGYTDNAGTTRPIYTDQAVDYDLYCCDEALSLWRHYAIDPSRGVEGQPMKNCSRVEQASGSTAALFQCVGW